MDRKIGLPLSLASFSAASPQAANAQDHRRAVAGMDWTPGPSGWRLPWPRLRSA